MYTQNSKGHIPGKRVIIKIPLGVYLGQFRLLPLLLPQAFCILPAVPCIFHLHWAHFLLLVYHRLRLPAHNRECLYLGESQKLVSECVAVELFYHVWNLIKWLNGPKKTLFFSQMAPLQSIYFLCQNDPRFLAAFQTKKYLGIPQVGFFKQNVYLNWIIAVYVFLLWHV